MQVDEVLKDGGSASGGKVMLTDGSSLEYDWLVVALGAQVRVLVVCVCVGGCI